MDNWVGKTLSKVRIDRLIGRGGMADVYLGRHITLDRPMAVKILHAHMSDELDLRRRFQEEAKAVASLRHPNIVQVIDFDVLEDRPYIVMELLEGMPLSNYLRGLHSLGHSLPLDTIARLIRDLASALDYAHAQGIVHRDVKPANIVLRQGASPIQADLPLALDVEPILTDFGVARIATSATRTASGTVLGTPAYMSPEQVMGQVVDARSDIYALGIILYEMLAGRLPFNPDTDTPASILYKHVHETPPMLPDVSPATQAVVSKAMAKDRAARYQQAGAMATDLQAAIKSVARDPARGVASTQVSRQSMPARPAAQSKKSPLPTIAIAGAMGLVVLVLVGGVVLGNRLVQGATSPQPTERVQLAAAAAATEADQPTAPAEAMATKAPAQGPQAGSAGTAFIKGDTLSLRMHGFAPPPAGSAYHAWLLGAETAEPLDLNLDGRVEFVGDELQVDFSDPETSNLLAVYHTLVISLELEGSVLLGPSQVLLSGTLPEQTASLMRLVEEVHRDLRVQAELPGLLERQAGHYASHAGFALDAIASGDFGAAVAHAEHTINILEGREGEDFGDYDDNGRADNPSADDVGLLPYVRLLELTAQGAAAAEQARGGSGELGLAIAARATELVGQLLDVRDTLLQILLADSLADVQDFGLDADLQSARTLRDQVDQLANEARNLDLTLPLPIAPAP